MTRKHVIEMPDASSPFVTNLPRFQYVAPLAIVLIMMILAQIAVAQETNISKAHCVGNYAGEVRGQVLLTQATRNNGVTVTVFDGFENHTGVTELDGSFCIPLIRSTPGTYLSVFAAREKFLPEVKSVRIPSRDEKHASTISGVKVLNIPQLTLQPMLHPEEAGALIGVCYSSIQGGRRTPKSGIDSLVPDLEVHIDGETRGGQPVHQTVKCNAEGVVRPSSVAAFAVGELPEGTYTLRTVGRGNIAQFAIHKGSTEIRNVIDAVTLVD